MRVVHRVIPACAGNMLHTGGYIRAIQGHPCVCGEYWLWTRRQLRNHGSSLRVRGIYEDDDEDILAYRVIPAFAGNMH